METSKIIEILEEWNFWKKDHDTGILRCEYVEKIKELKKTEQIVAILGVRRSGKSTIMQQFVKSLLRNMDPKNILYVNFEDMRFKELNLELLDKIYETYIEYLQPNAKPCIFLDEVHKIEGWEKFARTMHELKKASVFVSGSNTKLLYGKLASVLTGRHIDLEVFPLSFKEFLLFNKIEPKDRLDLISKKHKIKSLLNEYLKHGGFPLVCLKESKKELLETYFEDIINKDVVENHQIANVSKIKSMAKFYLSNAGKRISFRNISKFLGLSLDTVERYSYFLEEAYMFYFIKKFSYSLKEQEKTMATVYCIDNGLRSLLGFSFSEDTGWLYQNTVANHLIKKFSKNNIFYWMSDTQEEVDFVVKSARKVEELVQVCCSLENSETKEKEIKALLKASNELRCNNLLIITDDENKEEKISGKKIKFVPLWKWLLEK